MTDTKIDWTVGPSGCGKTYKLIEHVKNEKLILTASTGIAAVNLSEKASTIHSTLGAIEPQDILKGIVSKRLFKRFNNIFESCNGLAIDEAPMLSREYIDSLIYALDKYSEYSGRVLNLYLTGDIAQLPPISGGPYFNSNFKDRFNFNVLKTIIRQKDPVFQAALNELRIGKGQKTKDLLIANNCFIPKVEEDFMGLTLFSTKKKVAEHNDFKLAEIADTNQRTYLGTKTGKVDGSWNMLLEPLTLKVGAIVRCVSNVPGVNGLIVANGDIGIVEDLYEDKIQICLMRNNKSVVIERISRKILNSETNKEEGQINYLPIKLSFACTVHAFQGMTTEYLQVGIDRRGGFMGKTSGMAYVAVSRNTNLENLRIIGSPDDFLSNVYIDPNYLDFINKY